MHYAVKSRFYILKLADEQSLLYNIPIEEKPISEYSKIMERSVNFWAMLCDFL